MDMKTLSQQLQSINRHLAELDAVDDAMIRAIENGLPLCSRPYAQIADQLGIDEPEVLARLAALQQQGVIKRMGVVVRHRELGYRANAMLVWDVPDDRVGELGRCLSQYDFITLCYRRPRVMPDWPYNLFCMIHGKSREDVLQRIDWLIEQCHLESLPHHVLFSRRRFKQRGAVYRSDRKGDEPVIQDKRYAT
ncbi:AsnC family transcriptional regulator [Thiohalophilus sp.]|uniref:siroheme decarboxylase subunit beta n=1 Tax=Thiohalophilus sp. TaxID=3028392 RepID=UPI002ACF09C2|nr:AsnC family transcriptional regulator [Thiohalophilus sp.]MDZ7660876.1 AsnC family transcriptional regulator [Thiohalophilus sp.]